MNHKLSKLFAFRLSKPCRSAGTITGSYDPEKELWVGNEKGPMGSVFYYETPEAYVTDSQNFETAEPYPHTDTETIWDPAEDFEMDC